MNVPQIWCEDLVRIYSTDGIEVQALQGLNLSIDEGDVGEHMSVSFQLILK